MFRKVYFNIFFSVMLFCSALGLQWHTLALLHLCEAQFSLPSSLFVPSCSDWTISEALSYVPDSFLCCLHATMEPIQFYFVFIFIDLFFFTPTHTNTHTHVLFLDFWLVVTCFVSRQTSSQAYLAYSWRMVHLVVYRSLLTVALSVS